MTKPSFEIFSAAVCKNVDKLVALSDGTNTSLMTVVEWQSTRRELWNTYLDAFPDGTNEIYKERREMDCNCCKNFVRDLGGVVYITVDLELITVWDGLDDLPYPFNVVAETMVHWVKGQTVKGLAHVCENSKKRGSSKLDIGKEFNITEDMTRWNHFHAVIPSKYAGNTSVRSDANGTVSVFKRGLSEINCGTVETVLELIENDSLYKGPESKDALEGFLALQQVYRGLTADSQESNNFIWKNYNEHGARIRNTAVGTLLQDLAEGTDLETAVSKFETKVAPQNYKRPKSLVTEKMVKAAVSQIREAGLEESLYRRFATPEDLSVNDMLFVDGGIRTKLRDSLMDDLMQSAAVKHPSNAKDSDVTEISAEVFLKDILPNSKKIQIKFENRSKGNLMSIIGPKDPNSKNILKWGNPYSWSYKGEVADAMQERVKKYGGEVNAHLRVSLAWHNRDDLDLRITSPLGEVCYYGCKRAFGAKLDVDANARTIVSDPVENIVWTDAKKPKPGVYKVEVHQFSQRTSDNPGFSLQYACGRETIDFTYQKGLRQGDLVQVFVLHVDTDGKVTIKDLNSDLSSTSKRDLVWGTTTETFQDVSLVTKSPNCWGGKAVGNEHLLFVMDNCLNDEQPRGFYNEMLKSEVVKDHRKVFEVLGSKTKCELTPNQLSGLGFSSTKRDTVTLRVDGRPYKVNF